MSHRELDRVGVIRKVVDGALIQREAALHLGVSVRHVKWLVRAFRADTAVVEAGPGGARGGSKAFRQGKFVLAVHSRRHPPGLRSVQVIEH